MTTKAMSRVIFVLVCSICALAVLLLVRGVPAVADDVMATVNSHSTHVQSGKFLIRTETKPVGERSKVTAQVAQQEYTFDGIRVRSERTFFGVDESSGELSIDQTALTLCDGERVVIDSSAALGGPVVRTVLNLDVLPTLLPLPSGLLNSVVRSTVWHAPPLGDKLRDVEKAQPAGQEEVAGLQCVRFASQVEFDDTHQTRAWWFAPEKDYALVQYSEETTWVPSGHYKLVVSTVEKWTQASDGFWLPEVTVRRWYIRESGSPEAELRRVDTSTLQVAAINIPISDEVFNSDEY